MYYYFSSDYPAVIKINGIFYGKIQDVIKPLNIEDNISPFIEICPLKPDGTAVNFFLNADFLTCPPNGISVSDLKGGYLIKFYERIDKLPFDILAQEKFPYAVVTVFTENSLKLSIETPTDFYAETFNLNACPVEIIPFSQNNQRFFAIKFDLDECLLAIYHISEKVEKVFYKKVCTFTFSPTFSTTEKFNDIKKHVLTCSWEFCDNTFKKKNVSCKAKEDFNIDNLHERLIPYAFLENFLVGDNIDEFLCENIKANANKLQSYLGEFIGVFPPPTFRDINEVGLIYSKGENLYEIEYFTFELQNKKIFNIIKKDC